MTDRSSSDATDRETTNEGAFKAGDGEYYFDLDDLAGIDAGTGYSTAHGPIVEGERMQVGLIHMPAGTGASMHTHPNEQFIYVLQGTLESEIDGHEATQTVGDLLYIPPDTEHKAHATEDEDVYFFVAKDLSHGIIGTPVEEEASAEAADD